MSRSKSWRGMAPVCLLVTLMLPAAAGADDQDPRCAGAKTKVAVSGSSVQGWTVKGEGTWEVTGADGVLLEYRIDMDRYQAEMRTGAKGPWTVTQFFPYQECRKHTLRVYVFPAFRDGDRLFACLEHGSSAPKPFEFNCDPLAKIDSCAWQCSDDECTGTCTASASSGIPDYQAWWGLNDAHYEAVEGASKGPWKKEITCAPGERVNFKVRSRNGTGIWSKPAEWICGKQ